MRVCMESRQELHIVTPVRVYTGSHQLLPIRQELHIVTPVRVYTGSHQQLHIVAPVRVYTENNQKFHIVTPMRVCTESHHVFLFFFVVLLVCVCFFVHAQRNAHGIQG